MKSGAPPTLGGGQSSSGASPSRTNDSPARNTAPSFNFEFGFLNPNFADCILKLRIDNPISNAASDLGEDDDGQAGDEEADACEDGGLFSSTPSSASASASASAGGTPAKAAPKQEAITYKEVPVTALVLAAKSTFFLKLFTSGLSESLHKGATHKGAIQVQIHAHEEMAMMELLRYIYKGEVSAEFVSSFESTVQLLLVADRFGVDECFATCVALLHEEAAGGAKLETADASLLLDMPLPVQENPAVAPLIEEAKMCIVDHYGPLIANPADEGFLQISLPALRAVLQSDELAVESEEAVFSAVLRWAKHHFPGDAHARREVVGALAEDVRFPWMPAAYIKGAVMAAPEMRSEASRALVVDALLFMAAKEDDAGYLASRLAAQRDPRSWCRPRHSFRPPAKSTYFDIPYSYCKSWTPTVAFQATSGPFCAAGKWFTLNAKLENQKDNQKDSGPRFGLFLRLDKATTFGAGSPPEEVSCQYRFCIRTQSGGQYQVIKTKSSCTFSEPYHGWGSRDLLRKPWTDVVNSPDVFFLDGAMQFRCDIWLDM